MPLALLALAVACLSQPANFIRWAAAPIEVIGFWRMALAAGLLTPLLFARRAAWGGLCAKDRALTVLAGLLFFAHLWTFVYAAQNTSVANCMVAFQTHPLWTGAGAWLLFGLPVTFRLSAAYALAGAGVWTMLGGSWSLAAGGRGDLAALASALLFSGYVLSGRRVRAALDNASYAGAVYWLVALCFLAVGTAKGVAWTGYPWTTWAAVASLAVVVTLGGHALFTHLLASVDVNLLSCAKLLEPIGGALGAWAAFGEPLRPRTGWAFAFIAAGVLVLLLPAGRPAPADPAELEE
ncbi:MAG: DMT family transporter [Elusimicrobia bacterium]|nr:DMT family transporter [Elusimicrobiota bacterium]